ncbi:acyl carrier protein [Saccharothrix syringae]|uniref:Acyl carrier protein n=1 Tax=Saccharothrix syringae TaxID=103733 RepID=A0A5Q0H082_SACSY|nr:acyl carrier protein [Saccharothrix syringae]QFZ19608.1 acyl carrier protein [Saccharothrix syringae]
MPETPDDLRARIVRIVVESAEGDLSPAELDAAGGSLAGVSYSSLSLIRMIDTVENELGVYLDPEHDGERLTTVDDLVALVAENLRVGTGG